MRYRVSKRCHFTNSRKNIPATFYAVEPSKLNFEIVKRNPIIKITQGFFDPKIYKHVNFELVNLGDAI